MSDRTIAIQMAVDGADFIEVYEFFLERIHSEEQAFENTRRVFRGGVLTGGAPFTKDIVYLCLLYTSPSPRDRTRSRMPSSA